MSRATAWLYLRVSSERQVGRAFSEEGYSIEAQRADCRRKAAQLEAEVTAEFTDPAETATNAHRPGMERLLKRIRSGDAPTYVIIHKVDRFARNRRDDANLLFEIMESGAQLISATESIDGTPSGRLTHGILAAIAEYYSLNLSLEAKKGLYGKAKLGVGGTPGYAKIGYLNVGELVDGREVRTIAVDPERAPHISWAFAAYKSGGYTLDTLERALEKRGLRTRPTRKHPAKPLSRTQLHRILRSKYYMGIVEYGGFEFPGRHDPLTDPETFAQVQQVLDAHNNAAERDRKHRHYLKGSLRCECGERVTFVKGKSKTGRVYDYFACLGRLKGTGCKLPYLPAHEVEQKVVDAYERIAAQQLGEGTAERVRGAPPGRRAGGRADRDGRDAPGQRGRGSPLSRSHPGSEPQRRKADGTVLRRCASGRQAQARAGEDQQRAGRSREGATGSRGRRRTGDRDLRGGAGCPA